MALSRNKRVGCALAAVAILALVVDRVLLEDGDLSPSRAGAAEIRGGRLSLPQIDLQMARFQNQTPQDDLADRLDSLSSAYPLDIRRLTDAFEPGDQWRGVSQRQQAAAQVSVSEAFRRRARLTAILGEGASVVVVVNDHLLFPGQNLDGFEFRHAGETSALFVQGEHHVELHLAP